MSVRQVKLQFIDKPSDERQLFGRTDRPTNAAGIIRSRLPPGVDVFQRFSEVEFFQCVVEVDLKTGPGELCGIFGG